MKKQNSQESILNLAQPTASNKEEKAPLIPTPTGHEQLVQRLSINTYQRTTPKPISSFDMGIIMISLALSYFVTLTALSSMRNYGEDGAKQGLKIENDALIGLIGNGSLGSMATLAAFALIKVFYGTTRGVREFIEDRAYWQVKRLGSGMLDLLSYIFLMWPAGVVSMNSSYQKNPNFGVLGETVVNNTALHDSTITNSYFWAQLTHGAINNVNKIFDTEENHHTVWLNTLRFIQKHLEKYAKDNPRPFAEWFADFRDAGQIFTIAQTRPEATAERGAQLIKLALAIQKKYFSSPEQQNEFISHIINTHGYLSKHSPKQHLIRIAKAFPALIILAVLVAGISITMGKIGENIPEEMYDQIFPRILAEGLKLFSSTYDAYCSVVVNSVENLIGGLSLFEVIKTVFSIDKWKELSAAGPGVFITTLILGITTFAASFLNGMGNLGMSIMNPLVANPSTAGEIAQNILQAASSLLGGTGLAIIGFTGVFFGFIMPLLSKWSWRDTITLEKQALLELFGNIEEPAKIHRLVTMLKDYTQESLTQMEANLTRNDYKTNVALAEALGKDVDTVITTSNFLNTGNSGEEEKLAAQKESLIAQVAHRGFFRQMLEPDPKIAVKVEDPQINNHGPQ